MKNIIVLGSGRSGTSLLAGLASNGNYFIGTDYIEPRAANPKGFFEGCEINAINEQLITKVLPNETKVMRLLRRGNRIPLRNQTWLARLAPSLDVPGDADLEARIRELVRRVPYCFKDPRFCYTLPIWRRHLENEIYLCVYRSPAETASSILKECADASYLRGLKMDRRACLDLWFLMYSRIVQTHRHAGDWMFLHFDQLFERAKLEEIQSRIDSPVAFDFPDRELRRSKDAGSFPEPVRALYGTLNDLAGFTPPS